MACVQTGRRRGVRLVNLLSPVITILLHNVAVSGSIWRSTPREPIRSRNGYAEYA
jgi:hypothetical protein